jgi:glycosyltransferase involved in cell wall biosynthesis
MRIHFVLPQLMPYYGMEKAASLLMVALADAGCEVTATVISGGTPPHVGGLEVRSLDIPLGALRLARSVPALRCDLEQVPRDATIVASGLWASVPLGVALLGTGRTYLAWEHSVLPARLGIDKRLAALHTALGLSWIQPRQVITVSEGVRRAVARRWKGVPLITIPNIIEVSAAPPASRPIHGNEVRLLSASAFRPLKNNLCAIEAMRYLPEHFTLRSPGTAR